jgi:hypothetical protein
MPFFAYNPIHVHPESWDERVFNTVFICSSCMAALALAAIVNKHIRNAQPLNEVGNVFR